ncbi:MAG: 3-oxoacyl-ACP reductase FabG [Gammaproteobacteria bacterium]|nr:MAG: 3-oxoacyl-ACP reductase FabG [Gammaproteobacteria bacterium]
MSKKTALVTGATRGIGKAIALSLASSGYHVIGTATSASGAQTITNALGEQGVGAELDVTDSVAVTEFFKTLKTSQQLPDCVVNNAGITRDGLLMRMSESDWEAVLQTNLTSVYRICKAAIPAMMKKRWGRIVNIASVVGLIGNPGQTNYAAAKAGMIGFSKSLAREVASRGITVNCVAPGYIQTDMTAALSEAQREQIQTQIPLGRLGEVEEVATMVDYLCSPLAGYVTGQTLSVDGGMAM